MTLAWYEKMNGAGRSGQVISSEQLLSELARLGCRFRRRGSHITFNHDETDTRGTIVYGTRKLWSQKTVAAARAKIEAQSVRQAEVPQVKQEAESVSAPVSEQFLAAALPVALPACVKAEPLQDDPTQIIVRDRECPQIGCVMTPYDHPDSIAEALEDMARRAEEFKGALSLLEGEADFTVLKEGDVLSVSHPIFPIQAFLSPYDPVEGQNPCDILNQCFEALVPYADNQAILRQVIKSRKLELLSETEEGNGVLRRTYHVRRFQRSFGTRLELETTKNGYVSDRALVGFLDDVDTNFFNDIKVFMRSAYGFEVTGHKHSDTNKVSHPLLEDLDFTFPQFETLPKLRDIYARREELGEGAYIERVNRVLEQRDDILELVSYGLIFSAEQMMKVSNMCYDIIDRVYAMAKSPRKKGETEAAETDSRSRNSDARFIKIVDKKIKKTSPKARPAFDNSAVQGRDHVSQIRNQDLPAGFPYGKIREFHAPDVDDNTPGGRFPYMILKGPDGKNLFIASDSGLRILKAMLDADSDGEPVAEVAPNPKLEQLRAKQEQRLGRMMPEVI